MAKQRQYGARILYEKSVTQYCFYCGKKMKERNKTIDHIVPIIKGGSNCYSNLVVCCKKCNSFKGKYTISELINQLYKRHRFADESERVKLDRQIENWKDIKNKVKKRSSYV